MPDAGLSSSLFTPLVVLLLIYAAVYAAGQAMSGDRARAVLDGSFALLLLIGAYTVVLLILAVAQKYNLVGTLIGVIAVVIIFFGLLGVVLLGVFDLGFARLGRARAERRRTAQSD
jgi:cytochrome c biogenesis factor